MKKSKKASIVVFCLLVLLLFPGLIKAEKIELRLLGGMNYLSGGDINTGIEGYNDYWLMFFDFTTVDEAKPVHLGCNFGGDIIFYLTPRIGIGLGASYIQGAKTSKLNVTSGWGEEGTITNRPKARAIPIELGLFFNLPLNELMSVIFNVGGGLYFAKYSYNYHIEVNGFWSQANHETSANGLGFHGGIGLEFNISSNVAFVLEGLGRYAKIGGFEGERTYSEKGGYSLKEEGILYYLELGDEKKTYPWVFVLEERPSEEDYGNVREAKVDFSGFSLRIGIAIKF